MMERSQNYSNHRHWVPVYHFIAYPALGLVFAGSIYFLYRTPDQIFLASLLLVLSIAVLLIALYSRSFALTAQDRAIRAEENLRYYILAGKRLDQKVSLRQIIALRFAPDEEFVSLVDKASNENLKADAIKRLIKNWKGDYHRA
jgi:hypothetical protein